MSTSNQTTDLSASNFAAIFEAALNKYKKLTGQDLVTHPFAAALEGYSSPDSVLKVFRKQAQAFDKFRKGDNKLMSLLTPIVNILFTFSGTLGEGIGLPFYPAKTIFTGIGVLLGVIRDVIASYETLVNLFERIEFFLRRLNHYTAVSLTPEMTELLGKIMAQVLSILALSTKEMKERRIKKLIKRLVGRTDVEDALGRLDMLTTEENLLTAAKTLRVTHRVDDNVTAVKEVIHDVDSNVKATKELTHRVDQSVTAIGQAICDVGGDVKATKGLTHHVSDNVTAIKELTYDVRDNVNMIKQEASGVSGNVKLIKHVMDEQRRNQLREKLRTWLNPPNPSINHGTACDTQHEGTATWFIRGSTFDEWKKNGSLLWLRGNPGSGKSILCSAIIEDIKHMRESKSALVAYFYFDFKDIAKRDVRGLLASILMQLCDGSDDFWDIFYRFYTECGNGSERPSDATLVQCLKMMLDLPGQLPIYIIVDALDECPNNTGTPSAREKLLDFIQDLVQSDHPNLFICITSRPEQDINAILNPLISSSRRVALHEEGGQREDINKYLRFFVQNDKAMRKWRAEEKELVIKVLSQRADGMFRWVYCQLDNLRRCMPSSIRKALDELPITLDDTYERILQCIPRAKSQHAHRLFQCMVAAIRPLRVKELAEIFAFEFGPNAAPNLVAGWRPNNPEEAVLSTCSSLIAIIDDKGSKTVQFSHFSVKEFLTSDRLQTSDVTSICQYYVPLEPAHMVLAQACLTTLLQLDEKVDKKRLATFPLALYAAQNWAEHAKFEDVESQIQDAMECLFDLKKPYFGAWIWIHDLDSDPQDTIPEQPSPPKATPLYYVVSYGLTLLAKHLITTHGEDVNAKCDRDRTPLHAASHRGHVDAARVLLDHGARVNAKDYVGWTPLHFASWHGHRKVAQFLLEHNADLSARTLWNDTPLCLASESGHLEVARLLLGHGADLTVQGDRSLTPFQAASVHGHHDVAQLLLEHGAEEE